jgi:tetratricopeptide (TPR) repeat protein
MSCRIVTFYSWKGGVGRTMAMANAGVQLARRGKRILLVDWDLEAPGLERYFMVSSRDNGALIKSNHRDQAPLFSVTDPQDNTGLLGLLSSAANEASPAPAIDAWQKRRKVIEVPSLPKRSASSSESPSPQPLHLLGSGIGAPNYAANLQSFSWEQFFAKRQGGHWLEELRGQWREAYDLVLIDSRTGLTDSGGVCTVQMPDTLVLVFTPNTQSLVDGLAFLDGVHEARADFAFERAPLSVIPLLARWEGDREVDLADSWIDRMEPAISPLVAAWLPAGIPVKRMLERLRVPHVARFSFGEPLPVLTHSLSDPELPGLAYDLLASVLADGFANAGQIIEPDYSPPFDPIQATDAEIDDLVRNKEALQAATNEIAERFSNEWPVQVAALVRLAEGGIRLGLMDAAENLIRQAASLGRRQAKAEKQDPKYMVLFLKALQVQGDIRKMLGRLDEAILSYQESLELARNLEAAEPADPLWLPLQSGILYRIGDVARDQGDLDRALKSYEQSLDVSRRLAEADPSNPDGLRSQSAALHRIGGLLREQGELDRALKNYEQSLDIDRRLMEADPSDPDGLRNLSLTLHRIGGLLRRQGEFNAALKTYEKSLDIGRRLREADPSNLEWLRKQSLTLHRIGGLLIEQGDLGAALKTYEECLEIVRRLAEADPSNLNWLRDLSFTLGKVGDMQRAKGDIEAALKTYQESLDIGRRLAEDDPSNASWLQNLGSTLYRFGGVQREQGDYEAALKTYQESLDIGRRLAEADSSNTGLLQSQSMIQARIGEVLLAQGDLDRAQKIYGESLEISKKLGDESLAAGSYFQMGRIAQERGELKSAEKWYRRSLEINERLGNALGAASIYHQMGIAAQMRGDLDSAERWYDKSLEIKERLGDARGAALTHAQLGLMLRTREQYAAAGQAFLEAIKRMMQFDEQEMITRMTLGFFASHEEAPQDEKEELRSIWDQYALGDFDKVHAAISKARNQED